MNESVWTAHRRVCSCDSQMLWKDRILGKQWPPLGKDHLDVLSLEDILLQECV